MPLWRHLKVVFTWIPAFREQYTDKTRMQKKSFLGNFGKVESCSGWNRVGRQLWWNSCYLSNVCEVGVSVGRKDCGYQIRALLRDNHVFFKHKAMLVAWQVALHEVWVTFWKPGSVRQANRQLKETVYYMCEEWGGVLCWRERGTLGWEKWLSAKSIEGLSLVLHTHMVEGVGLLLPQFLEWDAR